MYSDLQLDFFEVLDIGVEKIQVEVICLGGRYRAMIAGGWWIADDKSSSLAIKKVVELYGKEVMYSA